jgi:hypothetical protein
MKKLSLTKKVPTFKAFLWDGTLESYRALIKEIESRSHIEFHMNDVYSWLTVEDKFGSGINPPRNMVMAEQYILFSDQGLEILSEEQLKKRFDVVVEEKVYTGSLSGGPLDAWNKSEILGDVAFAKENENE